MIWFFFQQANIFLKAALIFYFISILTYFFYAFKRKYQYLPTIFLLIAWGFNTGLIVNLWLDYQVPPFYTFYQSLIFFAWVIILFYLIIEWLIKFKLLGIIFSLISFLIFIWAMNKADIERINLPLVGQNIWFIFYSILSIFAYGCLLVGFLIAILYLCFPETKELAGHWMDLEGLNFSLFLSRLINFGFIFLTLTLITMAIWINQIKGAVWQLNLVQNWLLIFWLLYLIYLHIRKVEKWEGKRPVWLLIAGYLILIITFVGIRVSSTLYYLFSR
ncbi:MAG: cytochrome c biogenesis protein CcsA [Candidatus Aminicenantia bacterium]